MSLPTAAQSSPTLMIRMKTYAIGLLAREIQEIQRELRQFAVLTESNSPLALYGDSHTQVSRRNLIILP